MSFIRIEAIWTFDASVPYTAKSTFSWDDPFGVAVRTVCSEDLVNLRARYDIQFQFVCPREDCHGRGWWKVRNGLVLGAPTIDHLYENRKITHTDFTLGMSWPKYGEAMKGVGAAGFPGVFAVRSHIQVLGFPLFDMTDPYGFKYQLQKSIWEED